MFKVFYFFLESEMRRKVVRGELNCPGANYMLYGADLLASQGFEIQHNLEFNTLPSRWTTRFAWLADQLIKAAGGSSGDFQTVFKEWRRCREADVIVSTVDNVGVPLAYLNYFKLLRRPLLYISIGLPERLASLQRPLVRAFYRSLYQRVSRFAAYGWEEAVQLRSVLGLPADSNRVAFIPFGVDHRAFVPTPDMAETVDVLSIGADMQRDFHLLLEAAARLPSLTFQIITSSRHAATFKAVPPNVSVLTHVPFPEIDRHMAAARMIALPCKDNTYSSGTTTLLQAMAKGKAVVVSRTGAIRDGYQLENDTNCKLVTPGSAEKLERAIAELMLDPAARARLGSKARQTIEQHLTWDHYVARMTCLIQETATRPSSH